MSAAPETGPSGPPLRQRILDAIALLGGTASTSEVRGKVEAGGFPVPLARVGMRLHEIAREIPPAASRVGGPHGGADGSRLWRLGPPDDAEGERLPAFPQREVPQDEVPGRAPLHEGCGFLRDSAGHVWVCLAPNGRLRWRTLRQPRHVAPCDPWRRGWPVSVGR